MKNTVLRLVGFFLSACVLLVSMPTICAYLGEEYLSADTYQFCEGGDTEDFLELTQAWYDYFTTHKDSFSFQGYEQYNYEGYISAKLAERHNNRIPHPYLCGYYTHDGSEIKIVGPKISGISVYRNKLPGSNTAYMVEGVYEYCGINLPKDMVIPDTIDGVPVTEIMDGAFCSLDREEIDCAETLVIGDNVRMIGAEAFHCLNQLRSVTFGNNVQTIGELAFAHNEGLTAITAWGGQLETIGDWAFYSTGSNRIGISLPPFPDSLRSIGKAAFEAFYLDGSSLTIPAKVQTIASDAFYATRSLESLVLLNRQLVIERTNNTPLVRSNASVYCYAGSTAETDAQQYGYNYALIDGESLVFDGQTVEGNELQITDAMTEADFLARAASNGEECEVRLSGLSDGKVVNGTTVTLWNNRVDAEGKVYTVRCEEGMQAAGDTDGDGGVGLADVTLLIRYLAGGWHVTLNTSAADVNKDGLVNLKDATLLRRYLAGGWNVVLK